jgi:hypothetical protein
VEANFAVRFAGLGHEFADSVKHLFELRVVSFFQCRQFAGEVGMSGHELTKLNKGANDIDAHRDSPGAVDDVRGHERTLFGEGVGERAPGTATSL